MTRDRSRHLKSLVAYSDDFIPNPLIELRQQLGYDKQIELAAYLEVNKGVIAAAEEGMFQLIPSSYRRHIKDIYRVNKQYQAHRKFKRQTNFDADMFPTAPHPVKPMQNLLAHFDTNPYNFGAKACIHHTEIWKMMEAATQLTANMVEFLDLVQISKTWQDQFNQALKLDNPTKLKLATN